MERGTECEREALERAWAARERQRRRTERLLSGVVLVSAGAVLALVAVATAEVCLPAVSVTQAQCLSPRVGHEARVLSVLIGVALAAVGGGRVRGALGSHDGRTPVRRPR